MARGVFLLLGRCSLQPWKASAQQPEHGKRELVKN